MKEQSINPRDLIELRRLFNAMGKSYLSKSAQTPVSEPIYDADYTRAVDLLSDEDPLLAALSY